MRSVMLTIMLVCFCGAVSAMDKNDIRVMAKSDVDAAVIIKMAQGAKIILSTAEADEFRRDGVPEIILSTLTIKPVINVTVQAPAPAAQVPVVISGSVTTVTQVLTSTTWVPDRNFMIVNVGSVGIYANIFLDKREIVLTDAVGGNYIEVGRSLDLNLPAKEFQVRWMGYQEKLSARVKEREVTIVNIEAKPDTVYGCVYRSGDERDSGYLYQKPRPIYVTQSPAPIIIEREVVQASPTVIYQTQPVYVVREPVYVRPAPVKTWYFNFDFDSHGGHRDYRHDGHHR